LDQRSVSEAVASLRKRIANAGGVDVALVGVTKTFGSEAWRFAKDAGCDAVGENYAQEVVAKAAEVALADRLPVHFIGQLQSNKIKQLAGIVDVWQSVDRLSLLTEIAKRSAQSTAQVFLQVNVTGEEGKGGCLPEEVGELSRAAQDLGIDVLGLMTVGPTNEDPVVTRTTFRTLRALANEHGLRQCSMGMTGDLEIAVEEGSTMVRVGSALFGNRPSPLR
jgi:pyridoxal phosphate enzyme (YggS family)